MSEIGTFAGMRFIANPLVLPNFHVLMADGKVVWAGPIGSPIEDALCDTIVCHPDDFARIVSMIME